MAVQSADVSVGTTATALNTQEGFLATSGSERADSVVSVSVKAPAAQSLFVGGANVTTSNGWEIAAGQKETFELHNEVLYGVLASTANVRVLRMGVL